MAFKNRFFLLSLLSLFSYSLCTQPTNTNSTTNTDKKADCVVSKTIPDTCVVSDAIPDDFKITSLNRSSFPKDFHFGIGSAAYQNEGAANADGKGPSIWDTYTHKQGADNGDVATDSYHRYKEDVALVKNMGLDSFRFSISWSRLLPKGKLSGGVNKKGIEYYNNFINELLANGIQPFVILYHWDHPQAIEDEYNGFLSRKIVDDFRDYANLCFESFGDRVKYWITSNEATIFCKFGYEMGYQAPGRCSSWKGPQCQNGGNSSTEPYIVAHNLLLSHAAAVKLYREKYQAKQKGQITISLKADWVVPYSDSDKDKEAAKRALDFTVGWFLDPIVFGDYPTSMKDLVRDRLPKFTKEESTMLKGSIDFLGINYYSALYAKDVPANTTHPCYSKDSRAELTGERGGTLIGPQGASSWLYVYPRGIKDSLLYIKNRYNNPVIYLTENGIDEKSDATLPVNDALSDSTRIEYHYNHLSYLKDAIQNGVQVKGYFVRLLLDSYEWGAGYSVRFGTYYVDFKQDLKRYPKLSVSWFKKFLKK